MDFSRLIFFLSRVVAKRRSVSEGLYPSWHQSARGLCEKRSRAVQRRAPLTAIVRVVG